MYSFTSKYLKYNSCSFCSCFLTKSLWTLGLVYGVSIYLMMVKHTSNGTNSWLQQNKTSSVRQKDECATSRSYLKSKLLHFTGNITRSGIFCFACCGFNPTRAVMCVLSLLHKKNFPPESSYSDASFYGHMKENVITSTFEKLQVFRACDELGNESAFVWTMPCLCRRSREIAT